MTKADIVEALRCAASECFRLDETNTFRMWGSSIGRAARHFGCAHHELVDAASGVGVEIVEAGIDAKVAALLEAAQRIEEGE